VKYYSNTKVAYNSNLSNRYLRASTTQTMIMGQMERRRKAVYGPTLGKKAVIFVDDIHTEALNSATKDRLDMLLHQCIYHGRIFDSSDGGPSSQLVDINFLATARLCIDVDNEILYDFAPVIIEPINVRFSIRFYITPHSVNSLRYIFKRVVKYIFLRSKKVMNHDCNCIIFFYWYSNSWWYSRLVL